MRYLNQHGPQWMTALKALLLVATVWGVVYPALLWSLARLLQQA